MESQGPSETDGSLRIRHFTGFNKGIWAKCGKGVKCPQRLEWCHLDVTTSVPGSRRGMVAGTWKEKTVWRGWLTRGCDLVGKDTGSLR